jgi:hypothetical protein
MDKINKRITSTLNFVKRIYSISEEGDGADDDHVTSRPKLSYRFDEGESQGIAGNRFSGEIN